MRGIVSSHSIDATSLPPFSHIPHLQVSRSCPWQSSSLPLIALLLGEREDSHLIRSCMSPPPLCLALAGEVYRPPVCMYLKESIIPVVERRDGEAITSSGQAIMNRWLGGRVFQMWASPRCGDKRRWSVIFYASHLRKGGNGGARDTRNVDKRGIEDIVR